MELPGNTVLCAAEYTSRLYLPPILPTGSTRHIIILATNDVNDKTLFLNGLTQNILILYDMFESLGYRSYLLHNNTDTNSEKKQFISNYKAITSQDLVKQGLPIKTFIEIGMSIDAATRGYLHSVGAKIVKLYLGNILNIDIETIQNYGSMFFNHHVVGEIDEIWTSPHYEQHVEYAAVLNQCPINKGLVVPYVWDPCFMTQYGSKATMDWLPPLLIGEKSWINQNVVIMDPNISFQKCSFYSLLLCEEFAKKYPDWRGKVVVINGDRLKLSANAYNIVLPHLTLFNEGRILLQDRKKIHTILEENPSACFLTHQWNNDYNYMMLELMYCNYPILHNSEGWSDIGYHYSINEWDKAVETLKLALSSHADNLTTYKTHAANLIWRHSIHNPDVQERWRAFL